MAGATNQLDAALTQAELDGHELEHDPPANSLTNMQRFTCRKCGCAVLGNARIAYGSATESTCKPNTTEPAWW